MIRNANESDIPRLKKIRGAVRENKLVDPSRVTDKDIRWFINNPGIFVWEQDNDIVGFSAADPRDGSIWALFMDQNYEGQGIAQALLNHACIVLQQANHTRVWLLTEAGTRAERFYRKAGWIETGIKDDGQILFEKDIQAT